MRREKGRELERRGSRGREIIYYIEKPESPSSPENARVATSKGTRTLTHVTSKLEKVESFDIDRTERLTKSNSEINPGSKVAPSTSKSDLMAKNETEENTKSKKQRKKGE